MRSNIMAVLYAIKKRRILVGRNRVARNATMRGRGCSLCGNPDDAHMLEDDVWAEAGLEKDELACLPCVAAHLGRELEISDFTVTLINAPIFYGYMLGQQSKSEPCKQLPAPRSVSSGSWDVV